MTDDDEDRAVIERRAAQRKVEVARARAAGREPLAPGMRRAAVSVENFIGTLPVSSWTDEQWAAHEAKVERQRADMAAAAIEQQRTDRRHQLTTEDQGGLSDGVLRFIGSPAFEISKVVQTVLSWHTAGITVLYGAVGRGKTYTALRWLLDHPAPTIGFARAAELLGTPRVTDEGRALKNRWTHAVAFVIDDLGTEDLDTKAGERIGYLENIFDRFIDGRRSLLITTNAPRDELIKRYRVRMESRFDRAAWLRLDGSDRRRPR